jgi:hypothetical protein
MADTRAKVQITVDRLEAEVTDLRAELADLKELKQEVSQIRAEMVTMPRVEAKLTEMNKDIQKTLNLILQNMSLGSQKSEVVTPSAPPSVCTGSAIPSIPPGISVADQTVGSQAPVNRNLHQEFANQGHIPISAVPGVTTTLPATRVH